MTNLNDYAKGKTKGMTKAMFAPGQARVLTIDRISEKEFPGRDGGLSERKAILHWVEDQPPLTLNITNVKFLLGNFGANEAEYCGRQVEVWHDPTIEYPKGKMVGGLVLRLPGRAPQ